MPWTGSSFKRKHNRRLTSSQAARAARVANKLLREGKSEASAIRLANYIVGHRSPNGKKGQKRS